MSNTLNAVKCLRCDSIIISRHVHDFVWCACQNIFVDGGPDYKRRGGPGLNDNTYEELYKLPPGVGDDAQVEG